MDGAPTWHSMYPLVQQLAALNWSAFRVALCEALEYPPQLSWQLGDDRALFDAAHVALTYGNQKARWPHTLPPAARDVAQQLPGTEFAQMRVLVSAVRKLNTYVAPPVFALPPQNKPLRARRVPFCSAAQVDALTAALGSERAADTLMAYIRSFALAEEPHDVLSVKLRLVLQQDVQVRSVETAVALISHGSVSLVAARVQHEPILFENCFTLTATLKRCPTGVRIAPS